MSTLKIKLKTDTSKENLRHDLFTKLVDMSDNLKLVKKGKHVDLVVYYDIDFLRQGGTEPLNELLSFKDDDMEKAILDVTQDVFEDTDRNAFMTLCIVCAGFVTCRDSEMQEIIYQNTGRLAHIVNNPLEHEHFFIPDDNESKNVKDPEVTWFGFMNEVFSVHKETVKGPTTINKVIFGKNGVTSSKLVEKIVGTDFIYLPKTSTEAMEVNRVQKVMLALTYGKFVVAPDLPEPHTGLAFEDSLQKALTFYKKQDINEWIDSKQELLRQQQSIENTLKQFETGFTEALKDTFLDNLDYFLDSEEIFI